MYKHMQTAVQIFPHTVSYFTYRAFVGDVRPLNGAFIFAEIFMSWSTANICAVSVKV